MVPTPMRCKVVLAVLCMALSAFADKVHEIFKANRDAVLASDVSVFDDVAFSVGRATSPQNRGDSVGYTKAEEQAKWNLGNKHRAVAPWPEDATASEKDDAWVEYRCQHQERFSVLGMQRVWSKKAGPGNYVVVMGFPAEQVNIPAPKKEELRLAIESVRERKRKVEAAKSEVHTNAVEGLQKPSSIGSTDLKITPNRSIQVNESYDEDIMM